MTAMITDHSVNLPGAPGEQITEESLHDHWGNGMEWKRNGREFTEVLRSTHPNCLVFDHGNVQKSTHVTNAGRRGAAS